MSEQQPYPAEFSSFADWCLHKDSLLPEAKHTVEVLSNIAGTSDIDEAKRILSSQSYLDLYETQISDITPLQSLTNLTGLNLENNQISDITPLQSLTNLTKLNLENNQISDISPLQSLTNLTCLYMENNQISDITPLQSLTNLKELDIENNQISDMTPLLSLTHLRKLRATFTAEQKALIETCRQKWETVSNSTKPINRPKASAAVKASCEALGLEVPEIIFCGGPGSALAQLQMQQDWKDSDFIQRFSQQIKEATRPFNFQHMTGPFYLTELDFGFDWLILWEQQLEQQLSSDFSNYRKSLMSIVSRGFAVESLTLAEFCVSALGMVLKPEAQKAFECLKQILVECGCIFAFENVCYVCSRPTKLSLDSEYRLHAEAESAIEFSDGYKLYSYHGVTLPEKYGKVHPNQWQATWILEENNAELRRALIQGIGYARICQELQATELDSWQEYTLLKIERADVEPIYILKMTCPSTGFIHALRVPPQMQSAREAIRWVNWDVDYEDFSVQT